MWVGDGAACRVSFRLGLRLRTHLRLCVHLSCPIPSWVFNGMCSGPYRLLKGRPATARTSHVFVGGSRSHSGKAIRRNPSSEKAGIPNRRCSEETLTFERQAAPNRRTHDMRHMRKSPYKKYWQKTPEHNFHVFRLRYMTTSAAGTPDSRHACSHRRDNNSHSVACVYIFRSASLSLALAAPPCCSFCVDRTHASISHCMLVCVAVLSGITEQW